MCGFKYFVVGLLFAALTLSMANKPSLREEFYELYVYWKQNKRKG